MSNSNTNGRFAEFFLTRYFSENIPSLSETLGTKKAQKRDEGKEEDVTEELKEKMRLAAPIVLNWVLRNVDCEFETELHRLSDEEGKQGDVTDIRFQRKGEDLLNISLKHKISI